MAAAAPSLDRNYKYDVFLSFRGPDTRKIFIGHLHNALERKLLTAFIDTENLHKGEVIQVLLKAIEDSKLSVVVFSENYAFSTWCLKELAQIVECMDTMKHTVVPIFYQVEPADVRYQKKKFEDAFAEHEHKGRETSEVLKSWKSALNRVADLSGWDSRNYKDVAQLIEQVVEDVFQKLIKIRSSKSKSYGLVAMKYHMKQMKLLLLGNNRIVGIWGMGGLGKTTIAKAVYDKFTCNFDACCFLENVRHGFKTKGGPQLQEVLSYKLLKEKVRNSGTTHMNSVMINGMLRKKKLFIVLDDVDDIDQVDALLGDYHLFNSESRIIITTRDESVLSEFPIYRPSALGYVEALKLFKKHAKPSGEHDSLLGRAIEYTKGLPLAIKVWGTSLRNKSTSEWDDELEKIKKFQDKRIEGVLRTSFDGLDDPQKTIFLDVACFFKGNDKEYVTTVLHACDLHPESGLRVLIDRALITISPYLGVLGMHDLLQDMAWGIVRLTNSRLIPPMDDILETLIENEAMAAVESIDLDLHNLKDVDINLEAFVNMKNLRLLKIHYGSSEELYNLSDECTQTVSGDLQSLSRELRCLIWHGCPLKSLPSRFHPKHLVHIDMRCSSIIQLWEGIQPLGKLKYIDLSRCLCLREIPDLSKATNLEKVNLEGCTSLSEVHSSISDLKHLAFLNLRGCRELKTLPSSISMTSLETLELSGCSNLKIFPEISEVIKKLPRLCLDMTAIKELPSSIINLKGLVTLSLKDCRELETLPSSICQLKSLRYVTLSGCSKFKVFPEIVGPEDMSNLIELHLDGTSIKEFLPSTSALKRLRVLSLRDCKELKTLPSTIRMDYLESLFLSGCSNLQKFPNISGNMDILLELHLDEIAIEELPPSISNLYRLRSLIVRDCGEIRSLPSSIFQLESLKEIIISGCSKFEVFPEFVEEHCRDESSTWYTSLVTLRLEDCRELKTLPSSIFLLESLRFVSLSGCSKFEVFPEIYEYRQVRELHLDGTPIKDLPPSIERLEGIMLLNMSNCRSLVSLPDNICNLSHLTGLTLTGCSNLHNLPKNLEKLEFLLDLDIEGSGIKQPLSPLRLMRSPSSATDYLVGMDGHIEQMETLLCLGEAKDVVTVEIWGMCGIGKTTLASVVYNKIAPQFEHCCFLESVNEGFENQGAVYMQEKLLSTALKEKVQSAGILNEVSNVMMERLRMKKVLLVLDDILNITQIEILLGKPYALGDGSRIIITTRGEKLDGTSGNYCPKLSDGEALELFRKFAFRTIKPSDEYDQLSQRAIACTQGLPLALKALGYLLSRISIHQWDSTLKFLEVFADRVERVFLKSISDLPDPEKNIFLDVACFLKGREKDYVTEILRSCGFFPYSGLRSLIDRCLLTISHWDRTVKMYDSIHEVGRETARLEASHGPGERTRLWTYDGLQCVSSDYVATSKVEAINIDLSNSKEIHFKAKAFVAMKKLRLLQILDEGSTGRKQTVSENFDFLSHELRCLIWHRCPLRSLPSNFHPWNLVELDMRGSLIEQLRGGTKFLRNLKFINLSYCPYLKKIPDLSQATNLKKLVLDGCTSLIEVHLSIWDHKNLVLLSLKGCRELEIVQDRIRMISLKTLNLSGCSKFEKFPDVLEVMKELEELGLDETAIENLPSSIERLQRLNTLSMRNCTSLVSLPCSICSLAHLTILNLSGCSKLYDFPDSLRDRESLTISGIEELVFDTRSKEIENEVSSDEFFSLSENSSESGEEIDG